MGDIFSTAELARREPNITAFTLHPGVVSTGLTSEVSKLTLHTWCLSDGQTPCPRASTGGAATPTYVAVAPKEAVASANGRFFDSCKVRASVRDSYALTHGEEKALAYQAAIHDMASRLIGPNATA